MRKLISLLLALVMVMSFATVAFAEVTDDPDVYGPHIGVDKSFKKTYTVVNGVAPSEEFVFQFTKVSATDNDGADIAKDLMPDLADVKGTFSTGATESQDLTVNLSSITWPKLGKYIYTIAEVDNNVSGVTYNTDGLYMVVTVLRDEANNGNTSYVAAIHLTDANGTKQAELHNSYDAGNLTVTKTIAGNMADMTDKFNFEITLTDPQGDIIKSDIKVNNTSWEYTPAATVTITGTIGHGESLEITNIPATVTYTVKETDANTNGYTMTESAADGEIVGGDNDVWAFTNTRQQGVDTGITLDSIPFVVMMIVCAAAAVLFVIKRRNSVEF